MAVADHIQEGAMHAGVIGKFGMEGGSHDSSLPHGHGIAALGGNDFHVRSDPFNFGGTDENHLEWRVSQFAGADGAIDLAAVSIASNADVERSQSHLPWIFHFVGQQNSAGAGTKSRFKANELFQLMKSGFPQQVQKSSTLSARYDQAVDLVQLLGFLHQHNFRAQLLEPFAVGVEIALESKNTDSAPNCMTSDASAGVAIPPAEKFGTGNFPSLATICISS